MSEFADDDMKVQSESGRIYMRNYQTDEVYDGRVSEHYFPEQEREAVGRLTAIADSILARMEHKNRADCIFKTETHLLRRQLLVHDIGERIFQRCVYRYVDWSDEEMYTKSWVAGGAAVRWSKENGAYESGEAIAKRVEAAFPLPERPVAQRRSFGAATYSLLAKFLPTR